MEVDRLTHHEDAAVRGIHARDRTDHGVHHGDAAGAQFPADRLGVHGHHLADRERAGRHRASVGVDGCRRVVVHLEPLTQMLAKPVMVPMMPVSACWPAPVMPEPPRPSDGVTPVPPMPSFGG